MQCATMRSQSSPGLLTFRVCVSFLACPLSIYILRCSSLYLSAHFSSSSAAAFWLWTFRKPLTFFSSHGKNHQSLLLWERKASTHFYTFTDIFRLPLGSTLFFIHHKKTFLLLFFLYVSNFLCFFPPSLYKVYSFFFYQWLFISLSLALVHIPTSEKYIRIFLDKTHIPFDINRSNGRSLFFWTIQTIRSSESGRYKGEKKGAKIRVVILG